MGVRGSKGKEVKHQVLETESNQSVGGRLHRKRAGSHPLSLVTALRCAEPFFLMAMRGGRKQELQGGSLTSAVNLEHWSSEAGNESTATSSSQLASATACCACA